jgi:hypothetical protein
VQNLRWQRQAMLAQPVSLTLPITLIAVGVGVAVVGAAVAGSLDDCDDYDDDYYYEDTCSTNPGVFAGVFMAVGGVVLASVGTGQLIGRLVRRGRQRRQLQRIDTELNTLGATASLTPWMTRTATSSAGGLTARLRF